MPSNLCFQHGENSRTADLIIKGISIGCVGFSFIFVLLATLKKVNRIWPKRTELLLVSSVLLLQMIWTLGAIVDFKQLLPEGDIQNKQITSTWQTRLCFIQGLLFQFSGILMILNFIWYQYSRYLMLCKGVSSEKVASMECAALFLIFFIACGCTVVPVVNNHVGQQKDFYSCWVNGPFYTVFDSFILVAYLFTIYCSMYTIVVLSQLEKALGSSHPSVLHVQKFKRLNFGFIIVVSYLFTIIILQNYVFPRYAPLCFLLNIDIPCLGFFMVFTIYGCSGSFCQFRRNNEKNLMNDGSYGNPLLNSSGDESNISNVEPEETRFTF